MTYTEGKHSRREGDGEKKKETLGDARRHKQLIMGKEKERKGSKRGPQEYRKTGGRGLRAGIVTGLRSSSTQ